MIFRALAPISFILRRFSFRSIYVASVRYTPRCPGTLTNPLCFKSLYKFTRTNHAYAAQNVIQGAGCGGKNRRINLDPSDKYIGLTLCMSIVGLFAASFIVNEEHDGNINNKSSGHNRIGFRDRKIIEYENRIRDFSTPDKIFRYFATIRVDKSHKPNDFDIYMTPEDFVRSITPGAKQPEGLGLDKFRKVHLGENKGTSLKTMSIAEDSVFSLLGEDGLISFEDYLFLLTVLSTPPRNFEIAFKMFDLNGDGNIEYREFSKIQNAFRNQSEIGKRHRDNSVTGNVVANEVSSALSNYFFGQHKDQVLTLEKFMNFYYQFQNQILKLEFARYDPDEQNTISVKDFSLLLTQYSEINKVNRSKRVKNVVQTFKDKRRLHYNDFHKLAILVSVIHDVDEALRFYQLAGVPMNKEVLHHVAKSVAKVDIDKYVMDILFTLFDENGDGKLSHKEFISVMKKSIDKGLNKRKDMGFSRMANSMGKCLQKTASYAFSS